MNALKQSASHKQKYNFSIVSNKSSEEDEDINVSLIHGYPLHQYKEPIMGARLQCSHSEYLSQSLSATISSYQLTVLLELQERICNVYEEHQNENWDGYGAEPVKYLHQSLRFANDLFDDLGSLIESVDIIPENDGCLCFEWFNNDDNFISISVKNGKLIYDYKIENEEGCGETNFSGKDMLVEQIKKIFKYYAI